MKITDFEKELQQIDSRLSIISNPNRPGLSNIMLSGKDVCPIPSDDIAETPEESRSYALPDGRIIKHRSRREALDFVNGTLGKLEDKEYSEVFFE